MSGLLRNITNVIWHAFDALYQDEKGYVNKSKLKVLTANIGTILDMYGLEKGLDHYKSSSNLSFKSFRHYLLQEVFSSLPATLTMKELRTYEEKIDEICWLICRTKYTCKNRGWFSNAHLYKLFRIFCLLSDFKDINDDNVFCQVKMHSSEAALVLQQILTALGLDSDLEDKKVQDLNQSNSSLYFEEFLDLINFKNHFEYEESLQEIIEDMYQTYIKDIIKKGYILKRGYLLPTFKEYWFVLQPCELTYYKNHYEKELCGTIALDPKFMVKPSMSASGKSDKILKFILSSGERNFELATHDHRTRMQWITALQLAITYSTGREGFQRDLVSRRRIKRDSDMKNRKADEQLLSTHMLEVEKAKTQLEREKQARLAAETQARQFEAVAREDSRRVAELEDLKLTLEKLLKEETQAKKDEEIVRALQARVLADEWEKREDLEKLQQEQKMLLEVERSKRMEFETMQKLKEDELKEAERKLKILEEERKKLDLELKQARFKIIRSEENKEDLEARMDAMLPIFNSGTIRRTLSFVAPSRERPTTLEDFKKITP